MRALPYTVALDAKNSVAAGTAQRVDEHIDKWIQMTGTYTASIDLEVTLDGSTWTKIATALATGSITEIPQNCRAIRLNTTAFTSGTPACTYRAREARSE